MRSIQVSALFAVCCLLLVLPLEAQTTPATATLGDPKAYVQSQFGTTFELDPSVPPIFGDLDGDGNEDLVLVGTSSTPLLSRTQFAFRVEDPYDAYFGEGDVTITSQFTLHFDGSSRCLLVVFGWRLPPQAKAKSKQVSKFVLINTPFETVSLANLRFKKKNIQAIEVVDRLTLHALVFWDGHHWRWHGEGMEGDETLTAAPSR